MKRYLINIDKKKKRKRDKYGWWRFMFFLFIYQQTQNDKLSSSLALLHHFYHDNFIHPHPPKKNIHTTYTCLYKFLSQTINTKKQKR